MNGDRRRYEGERPAGRDGDFRPRADGDPRSSEPGHGRGEWDFPDTVISSYSEPVGEKRDAGQDAAALQRAKKAHELRNREKGKKNRRFFRFMWFVMVALVSFALARYLIVGTDDMLAKNRKSANVTVEIPSHATSEQVGKILYDAGVIRDVDFFRLYAKLTNAESAFVGGSYQIDAGMDYEALIYNLESSKNRVDTVKLTFKEGENALEIADQLQKNGVCSSKDAIAVFNGAKFDQSFEMLQEIKNSSQRYYKLEGYLFPDTYEFYKNEDPEQAVRKLVSNCNKKLTNQIREKATQEKMTLDQLLTLASMIQAEAADKDDMAKVSSVFHNRLNSGGKDDLLRLRSDPTTYYPYRQKSLVPAELRDTYKSRYDTYTIEGLPPGPICNPGMDAIDAALNPADTDYYYFCHDAKGKAYYAKTNTQHQANLKKAGLR